MKITSCCLILLFVCSAVQAQIADSPDESVANIPVNYTEAKVGTLHAAGRAEARRRPAGARRRHVVRKATAGDRQVVRGKSVWPQPGPSRRHELRCVRQGDAGIRWKGDPQAGDDLFLEGQGRSPRWIC